jgi:cupin fold WbuC family metalloprotein
MTASRALSAPSQPVVLLTRGLVEQALAASRESERKRVILPFHKSHADTLHRMFNALQPGTYVRPHRHLSPPKSEVFVVLQGALDFVLFDEHGSIEQVQRLAAGSDTFGIDLEPGLFHAFVVRAPDTLIYEVKPGPYSALDDKDFASWAPAEGTPEVSAYVEALEVALQRWPSVATR